MSEKQFEGLKLLTPEFRASFVKIFKPALPPNPKPGDEPRYSLSMLFSKDTDLSEMKQKAKEALAERFGSDLPKNLRSPFIDGDEKDYDGYENMIEVRVWSKNRPGLVDRDNVAIISPEDFYSGCYARATVAASAYGGKKTGFTPGVSFYLRNIQKIRDGEPFAGGASAEDDFAGAPLPDGGENTNVDDVGF